MSSTEFTGAGIAYRPEFRPVSDDLRRYLDCVEVIYEDAFGADRPPGVEALDWDLPVAAHATSFSPGRADFTLTDADRDGLRQARARGVALISEHLSYSAVGEYAIPNFLSVPRTEQDADRAGRNLRALAEASGLPVAVENPVTMIVHPEDRLSGPAFLDAVVRAADCGLLLDVSNLYIDSVNLGFDPVAFVDALDGDRVSYLHVGGFHRSGDLLVDTHGADVDPAVWALLEHTLRRTAARAVVLERDNRSATPDQLGSQVALLRAVWRRTRRPRRTRSAPVPAAGATR